MPVGLQFIAKAYDEQTLFDGAFAINCNPTGIPFSSLSTGNEIAGSPVGLQFICKRTI